MLEILSYPEETGNVPISPESAPRMGSRREEEVLRRGQQDPVVLPALFAQAQPSNTLCAQEGMRALH